MPLPRLYVGRGIHTTDDRGGSDISGSAATEGLVSRLWSGYGYGLTLDAPLDP